MKAALEHKDRIHGEFRFVFIEDDAARLEMLRTQIAGVERPGNFRVECVAGRFDATMGSFLDELEERGDNLAPTFALVDPFGFSHTPLSVIERIMKYPRCEVLITFMYEEVNRFLSHPEQPENYDALFGCDEWRQGIEMDDPKSRKRFVHDLYRNQLRGRCGIKYVRSFEMRNAGNRTDYFLFFGTNSITGLKKMKEAMWKVDGDSGLQFSDATNPDQEVLFSSEPDSADLKRRIVSKFKGREVSVSDIEEYVVAETPYRETHYKRQVLKFMEQADPPEIRVTAAKEGRRAGSFPDGTRLKFSRIFERRGSC